MYEDTQHTDTVPNIDFCKECQTDDLPVDLYDATSLYDNMNRQLYWIEWINMVLLYITLLSGFF